MSNAVLGRHRYRAFSFLVCIILNVCVRLKIPFHCRTLFTIFRLQVVWLLASAFASSTNRLKQSQNQTGVISLARFIYSSLHLLVYGFRFAGFFFFVFCTIIDRFFSRSLFIYICFYSSHNEQGRQQRRLLFAKPCLFFGFVLAARVCQMSRLFHFLLQTGRKFCLLGACFALHFFLSRFYYTFSPFCFSHLRASDLMFP